MTYASQAHRDLAAISTNIEPAERWSMYLHLFRTDKILNPDDLINLEAANISRFNALRDKIRNRP